MRSFHVLLLGIIFVFAVVLMFGSAAEDKPAEEAVKFLTKVSQNDTEGALREFGDNTCHCAPKGGYAAYLNGYSVAQEPNITFLLGKQFSLGTPKTKPLPSNGAPYMLPWDKPEDAVVYVPIEFKDAQSRPYFLPIDSAFGYEISEADLRKFEADPKDWMKAMTLRTRSSVEPGLVEPRDPKAPETDMEKAAKDGTLPKELVRYIQPADAGSVKLADGKVVPMSHFADSLPRLKSCEVGLKVVRRGTFKRWAIKKLGVVNCVLVSDGKEIPIATGDKTTESEDRTADVAPAQPGVKK